jgi:hypothetical protein
VPAVKVAPPKRKQTVDIYGYVEEFEERKKREKVSISKMEYN